MPEPGGPPPLSQVCSFNVTGPIPGTRIVVLGGGLSLTVVPHHGILRSDAILSHFRIHPAKPGPLQFNSYRVVATMADQPVENQSTCGVCWNCPPRSIRPTAPEPSVLL